MMRTEGTIFKLDRRRKTILTSFILILVVRTKLNLLPILKSVEILIEYSTHLMSCNGALSINVAYEGLRTDR